MTTSEPDFQSIADTICDDAAGPMRANIVNALRQVWNDRCAIAATDRTSKHGHDPAFDDLIADGGLPEARRVEDEMFRIAAHNASDANARLASTAAQRDELLAALKALTQDSRFNLVIGGSPNEVDALVKQVDVAIAKAEGR